MYLLESRAQHLEAPVSAVSHSKMGEALPRLRARGVPTIAAWDARLLLRDCIPYRAAACFGGVHGVRILTLDGVGAAAEVTAQIAHLQPTHEPTVGLVRVPVPSGYTRECPPGSHRVRAGSG